MHSRTPPRRAAFDIVSRLHLLVPLPTTPHAPHTPASRPLTPSHPLSPSASHSVTPPSAPQLLIPQSADRCWGWGWGWGRGRALRCGTAHLHGAGGGILQEPNDLHVVASLRKIQRCVATLPGRGGRVRRERRRGSLCARGGRPAGERAGGYMQPPSPQPAYHILPRVMYSPRVAHQVLEAGVGPRLEERLSTRSVAEESREVHCRPLVLPRRGDSHNPHTR